MDLESHARCISSNLDMTLRDLRGDFYLKKIKLNLGSLRGMSDLTLESNQAFTSSITTACDAVDTSIKSTYTVFFK